MRDLSVVRLLASYPRARPPLSAPYRAVYDRELRLNRTGGHWLTRLSLALEGWLHRITADRGTPGSILEIGAGTLNHVPYESTEEYDAVEPNKLLWADSLHLKRVRTIYKDIVNVPEGNGYDRVLSIAVLEHLEALPEVIARAALLLKPGGRFQAGLPSEGGFLWGCGWRLTTGVGYRLRNNLSYGTLLRHEHLNDAPDVLAVMGCFFEKLEVRRFPLPFHHLSFYTYAEASGANIKHCRAYLDGLPKGDA